MGTSDTGRLPSARATRRVVVRLQTRLMIVASPQHCRLSLRGAQVVAVMREQVQVGNSHAERGNIFSVWASPVAGASSSNACVKEGRRKPGD